MRIILKLSIQYPIGWHLSKNNPFIIQKLCRVYKLFILGCKKRSAWKLPRDSRRFQLPNISRDCCKMAFKRSKGNFKFQGKILVLCQVFLLGGDIAIGRAEGEVKPFAKEPFATFVG